MWLTQVIGSGISYVGRSPWTAADALVRLGLPESSTYPLRGNTMRITIVALIALAAGALAQGPPPGRAGRGHMGFDGPPGPGGSGVESGAGILRAGVRNAPFSADAITESSHTLADGNHIRQTLNLKIGRAHV